MSTSKQSFNFMKDWKLERVGMATASVPVTGAAM